MKKFWKISAMICAPLAVAAGAFLGASALAATAGAAETPQKAANEFELNDSGQSFGSVVDVAYEKDYPDLILAVGTDGTEGYIKTTDYLDAVSTPDFKSAEEAAAWQVEREDGKRTQEAVPLYAEDGRTVVGKIFVTGGDVEVSYEK